MSKPRQQPARPEDAAPGAGSAAGSSLSGEDLARKVADLAWSKKAEEVTILDLRERHSLIDWFVVATVPPGRLGQVIGEEAYALGKRLLGPRGWLHLERSEDWVCADLGDVVLHLFTPDAREFYGIEHLWADAPRTRYEGTPRVLSGGER